MYGQPIATNHFCYRVLSFITTTCKTLLCKYLLIIFLLLWIKRNMVSIYWQSKRNCFELYIIHVSNRLDVRRLFTCIIMKPVSHISLAKTQTCYPWHHVWKSMKCFTVHLTMTFWYTISNKCIFIIKYESRLKYGSWINI